MLDFLSEWLPNSINGREEASFRVEEGLCRCATKDSCCLGLPLHLVNEGVEIDHATAPSIAHHLVSLEKGSNVCRKAEEQSLLRGELLSPLEG